MGKLQGLSLIHIFFVLGQTEEDVQKVKAELQEAFPKLILAGEYALENCVGNLDAVINEMNATTPESASGMLPAVPL